MSFTIVACSDIRAQKVNIELPFERPPASVEVLRGVLESVFRQEEAAIKQAMGYTDVRPCEPFTINRLQRYDDDTQSWSEITSIDMLQSYDQLYVFRKNSTKADISTQRELPAPRPSEYFVDPSFASHRGSRGGPAQLETPAQTSFHTPRAGNRGGGGEANGNRYDISPISQPRVSAGGSPYSAAGAGAPAGVPMPPSTSSGRPSSSVRYGGPLGDIDPYPASAALPGATASAPGAGAAPSPSSYYYKERTTPERVEYLFRLGSQPNGGAVLTEKTFEHIFRLASVAFPVEVHQDLFHHFAKSGGTVGATMDYEGFQEFATYFPVLMNITYQRITNQEREEAIRAAQRDSGKHLEQARRQVQELETRLAAARKAAQEAEQRQARLQEDLYDIGQQRDPDYCRDEQRLLDKEVSVFKYRERLSREEQDYERLAIERRKRAAAASARARSNSPQGTYDANRYGPRD